MDNLTKDQHRKNMQHIRSKDTSIEVRLSKQKAAVSKMATVDLPEVAGFEMLEGQMKLQKLNKNCGCFCC